jgi:hypothetical protein
MRLGAAPVVRLERALAHESLHYIRVGPRAWARDLVCLPSSTAPRTRTRRVASGRASRSHLDGWTTVRRVVAAGQMGRCATSACREPTWTAGEVTRQDASPGASSGASIVRRRRACGRRGPDRVERSSATGRRRRTTARRRAVRTGARRPRTGVDKYVDNGGRARLDHSTIDQLR